MKNKPNMFSQGVAYSFKVITNTISPPLIIVIGVPRHNLLGSFMHHHGPESSFVSTRIDLKT